MGNVDQTSIAFENPYLHKVQNTRYGCVILPWEGSHLECLIVPLYPDRLRHFFSGFYTYFYVEELTYSQR